MQCSTQAKNGYGGTAPARSAPAGHWITPSARASTAGGMVRPRALAPGPLEPIAIRGRCSGRPPNLGPSAPARTRRSPVSGCGRETQLVAHVRRPASRRRAARRGGPGPSAGRVSMGSSCRFGGQSDAGPGGILREPPRPYRAPASGARWAVLGRGSSWSLWGDPMGGSDESELRLRHARDGYTPSWRPAPDPLEPPPEPAERDAVETAGNHPARRACLANR